MSAHNAGCALNYRARIASRWRVHPCYQSQIVVGITAPITDLHTYITAQT